MAKPTTPSILKINAITPSIDRANPQIIMNLKPHLQWSYSDPSEVSQKSVLITLFNITDNVEIQTDYLVNLTTQEWSFNDSLKLNDGKVYSISIKVKNENDEISDSSNVCYVSTIVHQTDPIRWDMVNTQRINTEPYIEFFIGADTYDFRQDFKLIYQKYLWNPNTNSYSITSGTKNIIESKNDVTQWSVFNGSEWVSMPLNGVRQSEYSKARYKFLESVLEPNTMYEFSAQSFNHNSGVYGDKNNPIQLRCGNSVEIKTQKVESDKRPASIIGLYLGSVHYDSGAKKEILITNNANDTNPVWEDASDEIVLGKEYIFKNKTKSSEKWCVQINMKITIDKTILDDVYISVMGFNIKTE